MHQEQYAASGGPFYLNNTTSKETTGVAVHLSDVTFFVRNNFRCFTGLEKFPDLPDRWPEQSWAPRQ